MQKDTSLSITDIDDEIIPEAPNFFDEVISRPGEITLNFSPAVSGDSEFRLEFFDRYMEWDLAHLRSEDAEDTPRTIVDLEAVNPVHDMDFDGITVHPLSHFLESVSDTDGFAFE